jgi:hypothetical protein
MLSVIFIISSFYLSGCTKAGNETEQTVTFAHPDAEETLRLDKDADIFQWEDLIYKTEIDWVSELKLTKKEQLGEIDALFTNGSPKSFKNGMANKLPIGAKIYSTKERGDILIAEYNGEEKYYLVLVEG